MKALLGVENITATQGTKRPPRPLRLSTQEACEYLGGIKPRTLKKWRHERRIPYYRLGHVQICFDVRDLDAFLARRRVEAIG